MIKAIFMLLIPLFLSATTVNLWEKIGKIYNVDPRLLYSIAKVESNFDQFVVAFSFSKMSPDQARKLEQFLARNGIESKMHSQVIAIKSKTKQQATKVVDFLYTNDYPRFDMGMMQINSIHKPLLDKARISFSDLFDPIVNIQVGAYVLANCLKRHPNNHMDAINAYNGKIDNNPYSSKVLAEFKKLYGPYYQNKNKLMYRNPS